MARLKDRCKTVCPELPRGSDNVTEGAKGSNDSDANHEKAIPKNCHGCGWTPSNLINQETVHISNL